MKMYIFIQALMYIFKLAFIVILKETKGIKIGMVEYKVLKYELNYFRHPKKADTERELHIIVQPKYM
ncbi:hypothetical protein KNN_03680 [Bacillus thuringiensis serovar tolworthi]|uniref:Uncharacterized protein n=1 Tax=Bacillus thuringiensis subsp. tolworthi TaxID=1442 RepID=A0A9W4EV26_BACTO|nr:hypothetical protein [Bacillus thuringiensis]MRB06821.1 hypothetical protein [Bacillus thuringiensis]MRC51043.1 hypothetical protein [Bacillus thuringiensis]MRD28976.1 hypothetical protein [Bacillus thuringiensis]BAR84524.1 hypothetical protein KNN_03680 [Bacillus thuringiensis serovar tolworthi]